jgi:hypothetical protein
VNLRAKTAVSLASFDTPVAGNPRSSRIVLIGPEMFLTVQARHRLLHVRSGRKGLTAMFETMTAMMGLVGAGIFLAHAFEGIRSRA